jgi:hypothetical protein
MMHKGGIQAWRAAGFVTDDHARRCKTWINDARVHMSVEHVDVLMVGAGPSAIEAG